MTPALGMSPLVVGQVALLGERLSTLPTGVGTTEVGGELPTPEALGVSFSRTWTRRCTVGPTFWLKCFPQVVQM